MIKHGTDRRSFSWGLGVALMLISACGDHATPAGANTASHPAATPDLSSSGSLVDKGAGTTGGTTRTIPSNSERQRCASPETAAYGAFDLATGTLRWSTCSERAIYRTVAGATAEILITLESKDAGGFDTVARSTADGAELWRRSTVAGLGVPPGPIGASGVVPVETDAEGEPIVVGVNQSSGDVAWRLEPGLNVVALSDRIVVVAAGVGVPTGSAPPPPAGLRGIDRRTGAEVWRNDVWFLDESGVGVQRGGAAITGSFVAVPTGATVTGVNVSTGHVAWTAAQLDHPTGANGVFVGTDASTHKLRAIAADTGKELWSTTGAAVSYGDLLAVGDGVVVVQMLDSDRSAALDLHSGKTRWEVPTMFGDPQATFGTTAVVLSPSGLTAVSTKTGTTTWLSTNPLGFSVGSVTANQTTLFVSVNSRPSQD
jgi:outer membrane protein assembly factor BamB